MRPFSSRFARSCLALVLLIGLSCAASLGVAAEKKATAKASIKTETLKKPSDFGQPTPLEVSIDKSVPVNFATPATTIFIANPDVADIQVISPTSVMVYGKKEGQTTLRITNASGADLVYRTVMVTQNLASLRDALRTLTPNGNIKAEAVPNGIILTGDAKDPSIVEDARRLAARYVPKDGGDIINRVKVKANNQVQIRVRFAEVSRDVDKRFGINWENIVSSGLFTFGIAQGADFIPTGSSEYIRTLQNGATNDAFVTSFNNKHVSVNGMIDALAKNGLVTILAEPSLSAMSGETASFLAGGEFPVPVPQSGDTITIEWKHYGVSLAFTPTIISDSRINLHIRPEVSQLSDVGSITLSNNSSNFSVPALTTRRAETTVELNSGQSFAIAGLLNNQQTQAVSKFPFLGDMPVLGPLFRSTRFQNNESELVIIITPYIVKPSTEEQLALPTDGLSTPTDADRILRMRETNSDPDARPISGPARAVIVENPMAEDAPTPTALPLPPVSVEKIVPPAPTPAPPVALPPLSAAPMSLPPKTATKAKKPAPAGPGGFIME